MCKLWVGWGLHLAYQLVPVSPLVFVLVVTVSNWTTPSGVRPPMGLPFTPQPLTTEEWVMCLVCLKLGTL